MTIYTIIIFIRLTSLLKLINLRSNKFLLTEKVHTVIPSSSWQWFRARDNSENKVFGFSRLTVMMVVISLVVLALCCPSDTKSLI
jgi:hypothetical protein